MDKVRGKYSYDFLPPKDAKTLREINKKVLKGKSVNKTIVMGYNEQKYDLLITPIIVDDEIEGIVLCSDGLTAMLNNTQIEKVLLQEGPLEEKVIKLIRKANVRGGTDNISIACLFTKEAE